MVFFDRGLPAQDWTQGLPGGCNPEQVAWPAFNSARVNLQD